MKGELSWVKTKVDALRLDVSKRFQQLSEHSNNGVIPMDSVVYQTLLGHHLAFKEVLCHNDLLAGNILLTESDGISTTASCPIHLIDYEYAAYNFLSYDLANHFIGIQICISSIAEHVFSMNRFFFAF